MEKALLSLERKHAWADSLRAYHVVLDGEPVDTLRQGKSCSFEVLPGRHEIFVTMDWCSSRHVVLDLAPGARVLLICQARNALAGLYNSIFRAHDYIELFQQGEKEG